MIFIAWGWYRRYKGKESMATMALVLTADEAFRQAGSRCFVNEHAKTIFVIATEDYLFPTCGDHLTRGVREAAHQYNPPLESVTVFWRS